MTNVLAAMPNCKGDPPLARKANPDAIFKGIVGAERAV